MEEKLWTWAEEGGEWLPLMTLCEARAAMYLLQTLASGDGEGHEIAYHLASALSRRIPSDWGLPERHCAYSLPSFQLDGLRLR
jgi:hypothetical protein